MLDLLFVMSDGLTRITQADPKLETLCVQFFFSGVIRVIND